MPKNTEELEDLRAKVHDFIEQAEWCSYECEGGQLVNNVAFIALKETLKDSHA